MKMLPVSGERNERCFLTIYAAAELKMRSFHDVFSVFAQLCDLNRNLIG